MGESRRDEGADGVSLDEREQRLVQIRRTATRLAVALVAEPFSPETDAQLRAYVEGDPDEAQELARELCAQPKDVLRARIAELSVRDDRTGMGRGKSRLLSSVMSQPGDAEGGGQVWMLDHGGSCGDLAGGAQS